MELPLSHNLNANITLLKLLQALKMLQRNKAIGLDGMKAKFILDVGELLHMSLLIAFNYFLVEGFPEALSLGWFMRSLKKVMPLNLIIIGG
jgi:hypothetical protein